MAVPGCICRMRGPSEARSVRHGETTRTSRCMHAATGQRKQGHIVRCCDGKQAIRPPCRFSPRRWGPGRRRRRHGAAAGGRRRTAMAARRRGAAVVALLHGPPCPPAPAARNNDQPTRFNYDHTKIMKRMCGQGRLWGGIAQPGKVSPRAHQHLSALATAAARQQAWQGRAARHTAVPDTALPSCRPAQQGRAARNPTHQDGPPVEHRVVQGGDGALRIFGVLKLDHAGAVRLAVVALHRCEC